jgi:hypothetical protein
MTPEFQASLDNLLGQFKSVGQGHQDMPIGEAKDHFMILAAAGLGPSEIAKMDPDASEGLKKYMKKIGYDSDVLKKYGSDYYSVLQKSAQNRLSGAQMPPQYDTNIDPSRFSQAIDTYRNGQI